MYEPSCLLPYQGLETRAKGNGDWIIPSKSMVLRVPFKQSFYTHHCLRFVVLFLSFFFGGGGVVGGATQKQDPSNPIDAIDGRCL